MSPRSSNRSGRSSQREQREENELTAPSETTDNLQPGTEPAATESVAAPVTDERTVEATSAEPASDASTAQTAETGTDGVQPVASEPGKDDVPASEPASDAEAKAGPDQAGQADAPQALTPPQSEAADTAAAVKDKPAAASAPPVTPVAPANTDNKPPRSRAGAVAVVLALLALAGVGAVGWQVYELHETAREVRQEAAQRIAATDSVAVEARAFANRTSEAFDGMQRRFGAVESRVADMEGQTAALEAVYLAATRSRSDQVLAEVEQAINAAAQQLQMAGNVEAAVIALEGIEARLAQPEFGHFHALRRALVRDLETLRALPRVDVGGIALRLELILERVDKLPLAFETMLAEREEDSLRIEVAKAQGDGWEWTLGMLKALGADVWNEVKGMIRLERIDSGDPVLLSPDQTTFLRENIKMRLLTARLALLSRDGKTYAGDVDRAREWMERYFDNSNPQVQQSIKELAELAAVPMRVEMPSLLDTFSALRVVQARGATAAENAPASGESR